MLIPLLLPLCNQIRVAVVVLEQPLVQLLADGLLLVVELVDVAGALMCDLEDRPHGFLPPLALVRRVLGVFHLVLELEERVLDVVEAVGWGFLALGGAHGRHVGERAMGGWLECHRACNAVLERWLLKIQEQGEIAEETGWIRQAA